MATIRRLTDSCVLATDDDHATLFDPGFHTFLEGQLDLDSIGDVTRVMITHQHRDHLHPDFVRWLIDRGEDVVVYANEPVASILAKHEIEVVVDAPNGISFEDVLHGRIPNGDQPPNRAITIEGLFTHPGDSREPTRSAPVLALPLMVPWDSMTGAVEFARRLAPSQVVPIHDFYLSPSGREFVAGMAKAVLAGAGIELVELDWGDGYSV